MSIEIDSLTKLYDGSPVVDGVSLSIASGELFVLLGPSGSGKSTLLRMIAGLAEVDAGRVSLHGRDVTRVSPRERGIGFVFQHYALFRHMTVADNVEFALRVRGVPAARRRERREELLQLVGLSGFALRYPRQLSGGQQQRVALARALAHEPAVLLLDEPFGALDARIRLELRQALRGIQRELRLTTVFVTHDQEEAFELADRVAILHEGRIVEVGEPRELYLRPRSPFVATFLGAANLMIGESSQHAVRLGPAEMPLGTERLDGPSPRRVQVLFRPEDVQITEARPHGPACLGRAVVVERAFVGAFERLRLRLAPLPGVRPVAPRPPFGNGHLIVEALRPQHESARFPLPAGEEAFVSIRRFHVLAPARLRLLVDPGDSPAAAAARDLAGRMAVRMGALLMDPDGRSSGASPPGGDDVGAETGGGAEGFDIAVLGAEPENLPAKTEGLALARHHLLLVPGPAPLPSRILVCVAIGEPGKSDVRFTERFAWQLGAKATVLTVLPGESNGARAVPSHVEHFLEACARALGSRGVVSRTAVRHGPVLRELRAEIAEGGHDLLVVGAPVPAEPSRSPVLAGLVERLLHEPPPCPVLVVRRQTGE